MYWEHLGPHFFFFEHGKVHFTSVDFGYHLGKRQINVLFNGKRVGELAPDERKEYSFAVPAAFLQEVNVLSFRFAKAGDGFSLGSPQLTFRGRVFRDPRDDAIRKVRLAHWGNDAEAWGGFIAGVAEPPDESPFHRRQSVFCFLLRSDESDLSKVAVRGWRNPS